MKKTTQLVACCASLLFGSTLQVLAQDVMEVTSFGDARKEIALTIYNDGLALVHEVRDLDFKKGLNHIALRDVSGKIKPETAIMKFKDNAIIHVLEQNFNFELLTPDTLSEKNVGKELTIIRRNPNGSKTEEKAFLLSANNGLIFKYADRIEIGLPKDARIKFDSLPQNLRDRPTLVTDIKSDDAGKRAVDIVYLSSGFSWRADYVAELNQHNDKMTLKGWVTLENNSGTDYENAKLQLVAGELNLALEEQKNFEETSDQVQNSNSGISVKLEAPLLDYHLYTLPQPTTLIDNQAKQVTFMDVDAIPVYKYYEVSQPNTTKKQDDTQYIDLNLDKYFYTSAIYYFPNDKQYGDPNLGGQLHASANYYFSNDKQSNLGIPIPKGTLRSYKANSAGDMQFLDQTSLDHPIEGERVAIKSVTTNDIVAYKDITGLSKTEIDNGTISEANHKITIENTQNQAVEVWVRFHFEDEWEILDEDLPHINVDANNVLWKVKLEPKEQKVFNYRLRLHIIDWFKNRVQNFSFGVSDKF
ncbi:DUF4139 domain-containing protein [Bartonella sp. HY329]|uniref:DUF4139 domain-containing protein n=1 Tax=unclassified Bartonella TaxID=2645622 RepID=UPI0021CA7EB9|nr:MULTISPECIES: DUF4139 domain-containing protein [unclassified Bartonella]UXM95650.1 DUF4139 domain-containing protein [Bartonella sp. HY329]UXN09975.1 DUF4139 domain-containing protein [Bartonella sp. HY328]